MDDRMVLDWLDASHRDLYGTDVFDRVLELTQTDLDPERGWRLVKRLVESARNDQELWQIGAGPLSTIVREHGALVAAELEALVRADPKYRQAFRGQISTALYDFLRSRSLDIERMS
jgi:hypothetical protein